MRQTWKDHRKQINPGIPMPRMLTMVLMLAIMGLIFVRLRDPNTWQFFAQDNDDNQVVGENESLGAKKPPVLPAAPASSAKRATVSAAEKAESPVLNGKPADSGKVPAVAPQQPAPPAGPAAPAAVPPAGEIPPLKDSPSTDPELTPTGPTDLDPVEQEDIKTAISIINDGNLEMTNVDMPAYFQILGWVDHQSTALLRKRAKKDVVYSDFRLRPDSMRLQIVELKLNVRQIIQYTKPPINGITEPMTTREGHPIYQVCGFTQEGSTNLYIGIVTDLPKGMPIGTSINEDARLVGYFFKLQGYVSKQQQLEAERTRKRAVPLKAPLLIGRLVWIVSPSAAEERIPFWQLATFGTVGTVLVVGSVLLAMRRSRRRLARRGSRPQSRSRSPFRRQLA